ncbi:MAG TPA: hypothetical protein VGI44_10280 [Acidimicrobiales bacterium]
MAEDPTVELVELGEVAAEAACVVVVLLGLVVDGGAVVVVVLLGLVVVVDVLVAVDFGGVVVVVVVVVAGGASWETGLEVDEGSGGYWRYRAPNPRKATAISAVDRRTRSRRLSGRLMKPRSPRFGRSGRWTLSGFDHAGRSRRLTSKGFVPSSSVMAPSLVPRQWAAS